MTFLKMSPKTCRHNFISHLMHYICVKNTLICQSVTPGIAHIQILFDLIVSRFSCISSTFDDIRIDILLCNKEKDTDDITSAKFMNKIYTSNVMIKGCIL